MIVDLSLRPPYKSLTNMERYQRRPEESLAGKIGMTPSVAAARWQHVSRAWAVPDLWARMVLRTKDNSISWWRECDAR